MRKTWLAAVLIVGLAVSQEAWPATGEAPPFPPRVRPHWPGLRVYSTTNEVTSLAVDSRYVWVGSTGGLAVVDKATGAWHTMTSAEGLPGNHVTSILRTGRDVWVTTETGLIHWQIGARGAPQRWDGVLAQYRGLIYAGPVLTDGRTIFVGEGSHWSGIHGAMVLSHGRWEDVLSSQTEETPHAEIWLLAVTKADRWFGLGAGYEDMAVARYHIPTGKWTAYGKADGLPEAPVTAAAPTEAGVWILTEGAGLAFFDGGTWARHQPEVLRGRKASSLAMRGGTLWVGTDAGLVVGSGKPIAWKAVPKSPRDITAVAADGDLIWCGTAHDGLWRRSAAGEWRHFREASGPLDNAAHAIAFAGNRVFLGGPSGISVLDPATGAWHSWTAAQGLQGGAVIDLAIDGEVLWYVTVQDRGPREPPAYMLAGVDPQTGRAAGVQVREVHSVTVVKPGLLLVALDRNWSLADVQLPRLRLLTPAGAPLGPGAPFAGPLPAAASWPRLWLASDAPRDATSGSALREVDAETGESRQLVDVAMGYGISSVTRDGGRLWVTSFGGQPEVVKVALNTRRAFPVDDSGARWVTSSALLAPFVWFGTSTYEGERSGLVRYDPATHESAAFWPGDGLPAVDITALAAHGKDLWVLTPAGVAVLPPEGKGK